MKVYKTIYSFEAFDQVKFGETVYVLDKKTKQVANIADLTVEELVDVLKMEKESTNRFEFWREAEVEENA